MCCLQTVLKAGCWEVTSCPSPDDNYKNSALKAWTSVKSVQCNIMTKLPKNYWCFWHNMTSLLLCHKIANLATLSSAASFLPVFFPSAPNSASMPWWLHQKTSITGSKEPWNRSGCTSLIEYIICTWKVPGFILNISGYSTSCNKARKVSWRVGDSWTRQY